MFLSKSIPSFTSIQCRTSFVRPAEIKIEGCEFAGKADNLLKILYELKTPKYTDYVLVCRDDREVCAHKSILIMNCEYFYIGLESSLADNIQSRTDLGNFDADIVEQVVAAMYTRKIKIDHSNIEALVEISKYLFFHTLLDACFLFMQVTLSVKNCYSYYRIADMHSMSPFKDNVVSFIKANIDSTLDEEEFCSLPFETVWYFISMDDLQVECEERLFFAIVKWGCVLPERLQTFSRLLQQLRIDSLPKGFIETQLEKYPLLKQAIGEWPPTTLMSMVRPSTVSEELKVACRTGDTFYLYDLKNKQVLTCRNPCSSAARFDFCVAENQIIVISGQYRGSLEKSKIHKIQFDNLAVLKRGMYANDYPWEYETNFKRSRKNC